jgi:uncharacterized protein
MKKTKIVLFHLGHPAHFHLFKNVISNLKSKGVEVLIAIKKKDVLVELIQKTGWEYVNLLPKGKKKGKSNLIYSHLRQNYFLYKYCKKHKPNLLIGTSVVISTVGKLLKIPSINVNEDDTSVVPLYAKLAYPLATKILAPAVCEIGKKWESKKISYEGYHELAYLHPNHFQLNQQTAEKYVVTKERYFILRFAELIAHHDHKVKGINAEIATKLIQILSPHGKVFITSERKLEKEFEHLRLNVNPEDIHHVMGYASLFIGDSQTMSAESAMLGVPFIRFNDFVGKISYLKELEEKYQLGFGVKTDDVKKLYELAFELASQKNLTEIFKKRKEEMLSEKIDLTLFMIKLIENHIE